MAEWYDHQCDVVNDLDLTSMTQTPVYQDRASISEVIVYKRKNLLKKDASIELYGDRIVIDGERYPFTELSAVTVLGRNKLNIYTKDQILQFKGDKRFNALKYVNFYHRHKNMIEGDGNGKFLGI